MTGDAFGQTTWREFVSKEDRFGANFPGEPVVTQITWTSEYGAVVPGRVYTVTNGPARYSMTVVDYNLVKAQLIEKAKSCPPDLERCLGRTAFSGDGYWKNDLRGAMLYAAFQYMKRDFKVNHYMWNHLGMGVEVNELQMTNNADQSRTFVPSTCTTTCSTSWKRPCLDTTRRPACLPSRSRCTRRTAREPTTGR